MSNQNNKTNNARRNPFVALCDYASRGSWCWNICCTTCGHSALKVSFSKIVRRQHPDDDSFFPYGKGNNDLLKEMENYKDFFEDADIEVQTKLTSIVAEAKLSNIQTVAKFPDWLGYIGLVMHHCSNKEARKIISDAFLPQFIAMVKNDKETYKYLLEKQSKQELLDIDDLSRIENRHVYYS